MQPPPPPTRSQQTWRPPSRRRVLPDLEGGIKNLEVGTKYSLTCGGSCVGIIPFCMALLRQCCTPKFWFLATSPKFATHEGGGGGRCARGARRA